MRLPSAPMAVGALVVFWVLLGASQPSWPDVETECTRIRPAGNVAVEGRISTYYEHDELQSDIFRFEIIEFPEGFFDDRGSSFQLIAWKQTAPGKREAKHPAVRLFFVDKTSGAVLRATPVDRITLNTINAAIGMGGLDAHRYSHESFLQHFAVLLTGLGAEWDGVTLNVYQANAIAMSFEALLPRRSENEVAIEKEVDILCR